jgi:hypothetical protein
MKICRKYIKEYSSERETHNSKSNLVVNGNILEQVNNLYCFGYQISSIEVNIKVQDKI